MSIKSEIKRLEGLRDTIRDKLNTLKIITNTSATLSDCTEAINELSTADEQSY